MDMVPLATSECRRQRANPSSAKLAAGCVAESASSGGNSLLKHHSLPQKGPVPERGSLGNAWVVESSLLLGTLGALGGLIGSGLVGGSVSASLVGGRLVGSGLIDCLVGSGSVAGLIVGSGISTSLAGSGLVGGRIGSGCNSPEIPRIRGALRTGRRKPPRIPRRTWSRRKAAQCPRWRQRRPRHSGQQPPRREQGRWRRAGPRASG